MKKNLLKLGKISTALIVSLALGVGSGHPLFAAESANNNTTNQKSNKGKNKDNNTTAQPNNKGKKIIVK